MRWVPWLVPLLALVVILAIAFDWARFDLFVCGTCGLKREITRYAVYSTTQDNPTRFSLWYARRIAVPHDHDWIIGETERLKIWGSKKCTKFPLPPELFKSPVLERLEPLSLDKTLFEAMRSSDKKRRNAALDAVDAYDRSWSDGAILEWWTMVELFLKTPNQWHLGFTHFKEGFRK